MPYHWSENAKIGLSFLPEWHPGCAISERELRMAEDHIDIRFPTVLRNFYLDWGNHKELTTTTHHVLHPSQCYIKDSQLIFAVENQAVLFWGIALSHLEEDNPPVDFAYNEGSSFEWRVLHQKASQFLDWLLFGHAFHDETDLYRGGFGLVESYERLSTFLELRKFSLIQLDSTSWGLRPESEERKWPIYYTDDSLLTICPGLSIKTSNPDVIAELDRTLEVKWQYVW